MTTTTSKKAVKKTTAQVTIAVHMPGELPGNKKFKKGTTYSDVVSGLNLSSNELFLNGAKISASSSAEVKKGDVLRVGVSTKNG